MATGDHKASQPPDLPLVYIPRGLDNSSSGQVTVPDGRFGPLQGQLLHLSFGMGAHFLVLREKVDGQPQGAVVTMPGEFLSGAHRGRFNPKDGQLYVTGMAGWGTLHSGRRLLSARALHGRRRSNCRSRTTPTRTACCDVLAAGGPRSRRAAEPASRPGLELPLQPQLRLAGVLDPTSWPPRPRPLAVAPPMSCPTAETLFLEIPDLQPVNQLHLHIRPDAGDRRLTLCDGAPPCGPFTGFPGYQPVAKTIAAHPILADMVALSRPPAAQPLAQRDLGRPRRQDRGRQEPELIRPVLQGPRGRADPVHVRQSRLRARTTGR